MDSSKKKLNDKLITDISKTFKTLPKDIFELRKYKSKSSPLSKNRDKLKWNFFRTYESI